MKFNSFLVGELFDIHPTTAYKMGNDELFSHKGTTLVEDVRFFVSRR